VWSEKTVRAIFFGSFVQPTKASFAKEKKNDCEGNTGNKKE
jgi:hypothetical protein